MAKYCPIKDGPALYLDCLECNTRFCEQDGAEEYRIIIAGSRSFCDYSILLHALCDIAGKLPKDKIEIISGTAHGADQLGELFAKRNNLKLKQFPADWETQGKKAGVLRNINMANYAAKKHGILVLFWDGISRGSRHMLATAKNHGLETHVVYFSEKQR